MDVQSNEKLGNEKASLEKQETSVETIDSIGNDHHAVLTTILKERPVKTWDKNSLHLYAVCFLIYLCSTMNGLPTPDRRLRVVVHTDLRQATTGLSWVPSTLYRATQRITISHQKATVAQD